MTKPKRFVVLRDQDGHKFKVPAELEAAFKSNLEWMENGKRFSDDYYSAEETFCARFWQYAVG